MEKSGGKMARRKKELARGVILPRFAVPMSKNAGICKTRKSVSKRFKITGSGRVLRRRQGKRHLAEGKNRKRLRRLSKPTLVSKADERNVKASMPFS